MQKAEKATPLWTDSESICMPLKIEGFNLQPSALNEDCRIYFRDCLVDIMVEYNHHSALLEHCYTPYIQDIDYTGTFISVMLNQVLHQR